LNNPGRKQLFLHVGLHKTGTTSIQWILTTLRERLRKGGFLYPHTGAPEWASLGQHLLAWSVVSRPEFLPTFNGNRAAFGAEEREKLWSDLHAEIDSSDCQNVILSSEEFDILTSEEIEAVGHRFAAYDVTPILFLRNHADFIESAYRTTVIHSAYRQDIKAFAANQRTRLDYADLIRDWRKVAVNGSVAVVNYDQDDVRRDSVGAFLAAIGLGAKLSLQVSRQDLNESVPAFICELVLFMRLKGCEESYLAKWISDMRRIKFPRSAVTRYRLMPAKLRADLLLQYASELDKINRDPVLGDLTKGQFSSAADVGSGVEIKNVVDALLALGNESKSTLAQ